MLRATTKEQKAVKEPGSGYVTQPGREEQVLKAAHTVNQAGSARGESMERCLRKRLECAKAREKQGCETPSLRALHMAPYQ